MLTRKFGAKCSSLLFCFIGNAVVELYTVLVSVLSKQLTCYWGSYKRYFFEASILIPMVCNEVTCIMISPYKVKWHSRLKRNGKRTIKKVDHAVDFLLSYEVPTL